MLTLRTFLLHNASQNFENIVHSLGVSVKFACYWLNNRACVDMFALGSPRSRVFGLDNVHSFRICYFADSVIPKPELNNLNSCEGMRPNVCQALHISLPTYLFNDVERIQKRANVLRDCP